MAESRAGDIFAPGHLLNNTYRIDTILGRGGTSEVYKAMNEISGRFVAIKVLKSEFAGDEAFVTLMRREEEIREIRHDAVVRYSENHRTPEGLIYLVMDYVDGPGLDLLMKQGGLPADDLVRVCRRVADGLTVAHARRIIHRDLSPDNIILKGGSPDGAVIIDFGIAKDANPGAKTIVGKDFAGKYAYAAPEQLSGNTDPRSDLYALGALLLAAFRGMQPDPGKSPLEVLQRKQTPLDTSGVPEPLKSLIDRMAHPDPARRFQSAEEVVQAIDATILAPQGTLLNPRTVVPAFTTRVPPPLAAANHSLPSTTTRTGPIVPPGPRGPRPAVWIGLVVLVLLAGGLGAYLLGPSPSSSPSAEVTGASPPKAGVPDQAAQTTIPTPPPQETPPQEPETAPGKPAALQEGPKPDDAKAPDAVPALPPPAPSEPAPSESAAVKPESGLPVADPYVLTIDRPQAGAAMAFGNVPSPEAAVALSKAMQDIGGTADLTLAAGPIGPSWGDDVVKLVRALHDVDIWHLSIRANQVSVTGTTTDPAIQSAVMASLATLPGSLQGSARIDLVPAPLPLLTADRLMPILTKTADCGPLSLVDPPQSGYGPQETIAISGHLADAEAQVRLVAALAALAPDQDFDLRIDLLNPALCQVESALQGVPQGQFSFDFLYGDAPGPNASGRYAVGENPVIDLVIPTEVTEGFVSVSIVDVSGTVFHVLPNLNRPEDAVTALRGSGTGPIKVRIAYPLADAKDPSHIAFTVDPTSLGKSEVLVLHATAPIFAEMRPTSESVEGFADALKTALADGSVQVLSLNTRILTTVAK